MDDAVEKLAEIAEYAYDNVMDIDVTQAMICAAIAKDILAAIQADPMAYVKPKPLVWEDTSAFMKRHTTAKTLLGRISAGPRASDGVFEWAGLGHDWGDDEYPSLEAAQSAAYDDLCKRVKELF